jgi:hypothetical protein
MDDARIHELQNAIHSMTQLNRDTSDFMDRAGAEIVTRT